MVSAMAMSPHVSCCGQKERELEMELELETIGVQWVWSCRDTKLLSIHCLWSYAVQLVPR